MALGIHVPAHQRTGVARARGTESGHARGLRVRREPRDGGHVEVDGLPFVPVPLGLGETHTASVALRPRGARAGTGDDRVPGACPSDGCDVDVVDTVDDCRWSFPALGSEPVDTDPAPA